MGLARESRRRRKDLVAALKQLGAVRSAAVGEAFAAVPREAFLAAGFHQSGAGRITPDHPDFLRRVYRDEALVTRAVAGRPVSSTSQPSLMAIMLEELAVEPGMRVLEIGAGTGYNAALLSALGAEVTSVDMSPAVVAQARAALAQMGATAAVHAGDGYLGHPAGAPYHRVIVTVGITGLAPSWLAQLAPEGFVVAPVAHAGSHPVLRVDHTAGQVVARPICPAGFLTATGPLAARYPQAHPEPVRDRPLPAPTLRLPARWPEDLTPGRYRDLGFAVGAWDRRATHGVLAGTDPGRGGCVLLDGAGDTAAAILSRGDVLATGAQAPQYAERAVDLLRRWERGSRPAIFHWRSTLTLTSDPTAPIWVPVTWDLDTDPEVGRAPVRCEPG